MQDQPQPTEHEEELTPDHLEEHEAMRYPGHENPAPQRPPGESGSAEGERANRQAPTETAEPQDDVEIHDA
jgi:hypothetical protein